MMLEAEARRVNTGHPQIVMMLLSGNRGPELVWDFLCRGESSHSSSRPTSGHSANLGSYSGNVTLSHIIVM